MNRREFIRATVAIALTATPAMKAAALLRDFGSPMPWLDFGTRTIHYNGPGMTVLELYRWLAKEMDKPKNMTKPTIALRAGDHYIHLENEWTLDTVSAPKLIREGSIKSRTGMWTSRALLLGKGLHRLPT